MPETCINLRHCCEAKQGTAQDHESDAFHNAKTRVATTTSTPLLTATTALTLTLTRFSGILMLNMKRMVVWQSITTMMLAMADLSVGSDVDAADGNADGCHEEGRDVVDDDEEDAGDDGSVPHSLIV